MRRLYDQGAVAELVCDELKRVLEECTVDEGVNQVLKKVNQDGLFLREI
jgi:hypothetical protein